MSQNLPPSNAVLVYDLRQDKRHRQLFLPEAQQQWDAYLNGRTTIRMFYGTIGKLYFDAYEGEHRFTLNEAERVSSWVRLGDASWYAVGRMAWVEQNVFEMPPPIGPMPLVTRLWIAPLDHESAEAP